MFRLKPTKKNIVIDNTQWTEAADTNLYVIIRKILDHPFSRPPKFFKSTDLRNKTELSQLQFWRTHSKSMSRASKQKNMAAISIILQKVQKWVKQVALKKRTEKKIPKFQESNQINVKQERSKTEKNQTLILASTKQAIQKPKTGRIVVDGKHTHTHRKWVLTSIFASQTTFSFLHRHFRATVSKTQMTREETNRDHRAKASIFYIENHFVDNIGPDPDVKRHENKGEMWGIKKRKWVKRQRWTGSRKQSCAEGQWWWWPDQREERKKERKGLQVSTQTIQKWNSIIIIIIIIIITLSLSFLLSLSSLYLSLSFSPPHNRHNLFFFVIGNYLNK